MDIKQLIGEATDYDKKVALEIKKPKSWCKSISAFANCYGGRLVFGVANDDVLVGLSDAEGDAEKISEIIKTHLNPIPEFKLSFEKDKDKTFVIVEVMKGQQTPYYYEGDGQLVAFMRIGNESVPATPSQLRELVLRGSGESYDSLKSRYDFDNMSFTKLKSVYKQRTGNTFEDTDYESFGLIDEKGNLTNAGALLADESPVRHSRLFCTRWNGLTKASGIVDALDDKEYTGSLVTLLQAGTDFVRNNSKKAWRKVGDGRIEMPDYPDRAVLEGVVNALIHRNYLEIGSEVHIDMFDDRIEIYSPGGMVSGISLEGKNLLKIPSKRRNPILADIFSRLKYMERRGSGFKKILADYEGQCVCGKENLRYLFTIRNRETGRSLYPIGSSCIEKFERDDLDYEVDVQMDMYRLAHSMERGERIELTSKYFSKKLLYALYEEGAFAPNKYNRYDGTNDYQFMLDMFNKRNKSEITEQQHRKIRGLIAYSIKPFLRERLKYK